MVTSKSHWDSVYATKEPDSVSWFQKSAKLSLSYIQQASLNFTSPIIDVGGGASRLVDALQSKGYRNLTVMDISNESLERSKSRLGNFADSVDWIVADITRVKLPENNYQFWHDRAVFHFLTQPSDRNAYLNQLKHSVKSGGYILIATFAEDGPTECSGLPIVRYDIDTLNYLLKEFAEPVANVRESHATPFGTQQSFVYGYWRKK